jgi:hypothetical protein
MSQLVNHSKQLPPVLPRVLHAFVHDSGFAIARDRAAARRADRSTDGNLEQVKQEANELAAAPAARVIAYEQSEAEKQHVPIPEDERANELAAAAAHRPTEPGEDEDDPDKDNEVRGLVVELSKAMARLAISVAKDGIPQLKAGNGADTRPSTKPPVRAGGRPTTAPPAQPYRGTAADIRDAQIAGAGKAMDEANARVTDGVDPLKEAGFDVPLHFEWDSISCRYRIT